MFWDKKLRRWAEAVRARADLPARLVLWNGEQFDFGRFEQPRVTLTVRSASALPLLLDPSLDHLGQAYVKGQIDIDGRLPDIIDFGYALARRMSKTQGAGKGPGRLALAARAARRFRHSRSTDRESIQYHYDVSDDFYRLWLDEGMVYSCAYFENGDEDLATAQRKKLDHILTKIRLQPGQRLLDIGCGWGALVLRAAQHFGAHCVGVTLSRNQFEAATERVRAAGLADRIEIRLQDYRDVQGRFDRITSVGMFEHVGRRNLPMYFAHMRELLADDGLALNHGITSTDADVGATALGGGAFIDRYVFPDGELPHLSLALEAMQRGGWRCWMWRGCGGITCARCSCGWSGLRLVCRRFGRWWRRRGFGFGGCIWRGVLMRLNTMTCLSFRLFVGGRGRGLLRWLGRGGICTSASCPDVLGRGRCVACS